MAATRLRPGKIAPNEICPATLRLLPPPPLLPPFLLTASVEEALDDDCEDEDGRSNGSVGCAVVISGAAFSIGDNTVDDDGALSVREFEEVSPARSDFGNEDNEEVDVGTKDEESTALESLCGLVDGRQGQSTLNEPMLTRDVHRALGASVPLSEQYGSV